MKGVILIIMIPYKQLSLADIFQIAMKNLKMTNLRFFPYQKPISILMKLSRSFRNHFYASTGTPRKYPLQAFLCALSIQHIFSIPTDQLLLTFLDYSKPLHEFCNFIKVPNASKITCFKQDFLMICSLYLVNLLTLQTPSDRLLIRQKQI